jgi:hypothetical protein
LKWSLGTTLSKPTAFLANLGIVHAGATACLAGRNVPAAATYPAGSISDDLIVAAPIVIITVANLGALTAKGFHLVSSLSSWSDDRDLGAAPAVKRIIPAFHLFRVLHAIPEDSVRNAQDAGDNHQN